MAGWKFEMRIFVTGGTGFLGSHVVRELHGEGHALLLLSRQSESAFSKMPNIGIVQGDLSDSANWENRVKRFKPQVAIHMAWASLPDYDARTSIGNLNYGLNLIALLAESGCESVICTGSCWEYGQQAGMLREDIALKPYNAFSAAKNALHWVGREIAREHGMHFIWTRIFYVYGPGQRGTSLIPHIIDCVRKGENPEIKTPWDKNDFVYVEDVARAVSAIVGAPQTDGVYNIGSGSSTSIQKVVEIVCNKFKFPGQCGTLIDRTISPAVDFYSDISKIRSDIGWEPKIGIGEGIGKTIDYYTGGVAQ
jgi:nucleoside-diphosphate-sugar epimerase